MGPHGLEHDQRPKTFTTGLREFDPVNVGYQTTAPASMPRTPLGGPFAFDTSLPGNSNRGHEYSTNLSEPERLDLIEYLKTL